MFIYRKWTISPKFCHTIRHSDRISQQNSEMVKDDANLEWRLKRVRKLHGDTMSLNIGGFWPWFIQKVHLDLCIVFLTNRPFGSSQLTILLLRLPIDLWSALVRSVSSNELQFNLGNNRGQNSSTLDRKLLVWRKHVRYWLGENVQCNMTIEQPLSNQDKNRGNVESYCVFVEFPILRFDEGSIK